MSAFVWNEFTFDIANQLITVADTEDRSKVQDIFNAARLAEESDHGMEHTKICDGGGKVDLEPGVSATGIVVTLLEGWRIVSAKTSGTYTIGDGSLVRWDTGVDVFQTNNLCNQINNTSEAGVAVTVGASAQDVADIRAIQGEIRALLRAKRVTSRAQSKLVLTYTPDALSPDGIDALADLFENEGESLPYDGQGIEVQGEVVDQP